MFSLGLVIGGCLMFFASSIDHGCFTKKGCKSSKRK